VYFCPAPFVPRLVENLGPLYTGEISAVSCILDGTIASLPPP
jgi:hypothetical protein